MSDTEKKEEKPAVSTDAAGSPSSGGTTSVKPETQKELSEDPSESETISIKVTDNQTEVTFKVRKKTPLHKVMDSFCKRTGKDSDSLRFTFDGERVAKDDTPGSLAMEDGDKIEALNQQTGGFCSDF